MIQSRIFYIKNMSFKAIRRCGVVNKSLMHEINVNDFGSQCLLKVYVCKF